MTVNVQDVGAINMKKIVFFIILFLIYTAVICFCPVVTQWDRNVIAAVQDYLKDLPVWIPMLLDSKLYATFIVLPLLIGFVYFFKNLLLWDIIIFSSSPLIAYIMNSVLKIIVQRPRPPIDLQIAVHPDSFSFVSNHTFITCSLWGLVIYYLIKYCSNKFLKYTGICFGILWMAFVGFSRIWIGVHNPTDVFGGYFLAIILLMIYIKIIRTIGGKI